jgi:glycosyltransferase involved in cell wall biosynthesis
VRVLLVAMPGSVHTARWIDQIAGEGWDLHLSPSIWQAPHPGLKGITVHTTVVGRRGADSPASLKVRGLWPFRRGSEAVYWLANRSTAQRWLRPATRLADLIRRIRPDVVHSLEFQGAGYLVLEAAEQLGGRMPPWVATNWGSDVYLFARLSAHRERVRSVLSRCDFYSCETERDVKLARGLGFRGEVWPVVPNSGGLDLARCEGLRQGAASTRRLVLLKGYQHFAGRALVGLRALARCADALSGYRVAVYSATPEVALASELFSSETGIPTDIVGACSHDAMLSLFGRARIYLGLSIADAIPTSLLEAMAMGAFPIQSATSGADEWIVDGESGLVVPPEDPEVVESAVRIALGDDALVDRAGAINIETARHRLDVGSIREKVVASYRRAAEGRAARLRGSSC